MIVGDFYFSDRRIAKWLRVLNIEIVGNLRNHYYVEDLIDIRLAYLLKILYNDPHCRIYGGYEKLENGKLKKVSTLHIVYTYD